MLEKLFLEMIAYYSGDPKRIQHFTKVHSYAKLIGEREQLSPEELYILEAAAYTHDIGIKPAEEKCGSSEGKLQEQEGPALLRERWFCECGLKLGGLKCDGGAALRDLRLHPSSGGCAF